MCVPKPEMPAAQPTLIPSMQSASAFQAGGDTSAGAAQIGRLQLRLGGVTALNPTGGGTTNSTTPLAPTAPATAVTPAVAGQQAAAGNAGLPFAATSWLPPTTAFTRMQGFGPSGGKL